MGMALAITPACPETHQLIPWLEVSKDQVTNLTSYMIHTFNTEGVKTLGGLTYKELTIESGNNKHGYLDLLWKCKQLIF